MGFWIFLGSFLAVALGITLLVLYIRKKIRKISQRFLGGPNIIEALEQIDTAHEDIPRTLSGCDSLLLPQILKDFPDFDVGLAKTYVRDQLRKRFSNRSSFKVHNVVIAKYLRTGAQKTIVFQAATCHRENGKPVQKRYDLHYTHILSHTTDSIAANCPNCGGALGFGITTCEYCGSRVANVLRNTWKFTEVRET